MRSMGGRTATGERVVSSLPCGQLLLDGLGRTVQARARGPRLANHVVALKEGWPLVLGFRETPYSLVHVENMRRLILAGATLLPPVPAFYIGGERPRPLPRPLHAPPPRSPRDPVARRPRGGPAALEGGAVMRGLAGPARPRDVDGLTTGVFERVEASAAAGSRVPLPGCRRLTRGRKRHSPPRVPGAGGQPRRAPRGLRGVCRQPGGRDHGGAHLGHDGAPADTSCSNRMRKAGSWGAVGSPGPLREGPGAVGQLDC